jgi:valyl-tRNA synthetase
MVMYKVLEKFLRALHPFMPFISEEIWQKLPHQGISIMTQGYPRLQPALIDKKCECSMQWVFELINRIRNMRSELEIPLADYIKVRISTSDKQKKALFVSLAGEIKHLARLSEISLPKATDRPKGKYAAVASDTHITILLAGLKDAGRYKASLLKKIFKIEEEVNSKEGLLSNRAFLKKAPDKIIRGERERLKQMRETLKKLKAVKNALRE